FVVFHLGWRAPGSPLIGACCDQPSTVNLLSWTAFAVSHGRDPLVTHALNAPQGINLMWQPNGMPLLGLVATPFELLLGPIATYNLLVTLALPLSGLAAYAALRRWVGGTAGPFVGGFLYGFSPFMFTHALGHLNILFVPLPPLLLLVLTDLLSGRRRTWWASGLIIGVLGVAQLLVGQEVFAGTAIAAVFVVAVVAASHREAIARRWKQVTAGLAVAGATFVVLAGWPLVVLLAGPDRLHGRWEAPISVDLLNLFLPSVTGQFRPDGASYFFAWGWSQGEAVGYLGVVLIVLCVVVAARSWSRDAVRVASVVGGCMLVLSLGPTVMAAGVNLKIWLPARVLLALPFFENMLPARLFVFVDLAVAVLLAEFVRAAMARGPVGPGAQGRAEGSDAPTSGGAGRRRGSPAARRFGALVAVVAALLPLMPSIHYEVYRYPTPRFFSTAAVDVIPAGATALVVPFPEGGPHDGAPMVWQAVARFRFSMVGGYVFVPPAGGAAGATVGGPPDTLTSTLTAIANGDPTPPLTPVRLEAMRHDLARFVLDAVVLGPMPGHARALALLDQVIGRQPVADRGVELWNDVR
ncbi:MAG: glycosyltransferase 87 family protein, partial [Actinomycetota bacterium]|nr:glycosyltransferase 87 family protein [Actinomycetota bacterium]